MSAKPINCLIKTMSLFCVIIMLLGTFSLQFFFFTRSDCYSFNLIDVILWWCLTRLLFCNSSKKNVTLLGNVVLWHIMKSALPLGHFELRLKRYLSSSCLRFSGSSVNPGVPGLPDSKSKLGDPFPCASRWHSSIKISTATTNCKLNSPSQSTDVGIEHDFQHLVFHLTW